MKKVIRIASGAAAMLAASAAFAGGPLTICAQAAVRYPGAGTVTLNYDQGNLGGLSKASADALVTSAVANWTNVTTATVSINRGLDLPLDVTSANYQQYVSSNASFSDGLSPVVYDTDGSIIDLMLGTGASGSVMGFAGSGYSIASNGTCTYAEGRAVINGRFGTNPAMKMVLTHEIGHLIGMDHTQLDSQQGLPTTNYPVMYPVAYRNTDALHEDDVAAVSALYPDTTLNAVYGSLSGTFTQAGIPVKGANLWAQETTTGKLYSIVSDYLTQGTGFFKLLLPAGTYTLRAGAIRSSFTGGSSVGPYSDVSTDPSFQAPLYNGGVAMATVTLGNATPTAITITPGCSASVAFKLDGSGTVTGNCTPAVQTLALTVTRNGTGDGTVTSSPAGINCGTSCSANLAMNSAVTLTAAPSSGSIFSGWAGACTGSSANCTFTMSAARTATATFTANYSGTLTVRYRLYNPSTSEHLYTTQINEYNTLAGLGWLPEGSIYKLFSGPGAFGGVIAVPYYRLYNPSSAQHHWTTDANEYAILGKTAGWSQEGIDGYILPAAATGAVPLYRLYLNARGGLHLWTIDANEMNVLTTTAGWTYEGIAGYVLPLP